MIDDDDFEALLNEDNSKAKQASYHGTDDQSTEVIQPSWNVSEQSKKTMKSEKLEEHYIERTP